MKWGLVARNVATLVDPPRVERHEVQPFTPDQAQRFLLAVRDERLGPLYAIALLLGVRQGEALGLRWADIADLEGKDPTLTIAQALQRIDREFRFVAPKTERSRRRIALSKSAVEALIAQRRRQAAERLAAGPGWQDMGLVFTMPDGAPIERTTLRGDFKRILQTNGLPNIRFHDLRHSTASLLLAQGAHPRVVMELLGHSQISLTMDTYSHVMPSMMRAAVDSIEEALRVKQQSTR